MEKAWFKATREICGLSQQDVADALGVSVKSVKRWENPYIDGYQIPEEAIEYIKAEKEMFDSVSAAAIDKVCETAEQAGIDPVTIQLSYFRDQDMYDRHGRDDGSYAVVNARTRAVASALEYLGFNVSFSYPDDDGRIRTP